MGGWRKTLRGMVADRKSRSYTYDQAAVVLRHLGFQLATPRSGTSHRKWRRLIQNDSGRTGTSLIVIGLVDHGSGAMKPEYVKEMIDTLEKHGLITDIDL